MSELTTTTIIDGDGVPGQPARVLEVARGTFVWRIVASHMTSYFVVGWLASTLLDYKGLLGTRNAEGAELWSFMRAFDSPWIAAGPALQALRGVLFGCVLWPLKGLWLERTDGAFRMWLLFLGLAILGPTGAAPGSLEGLIYTRLTFWDHLLGLPEMCLQTWLFAAMVRHWYVRGGRGWNRTMVAAVALVCLLSGLGILAALFPGSFAP